MSFQRHKIPPFRLGRTFVTADNARVFGVNLMTTLMLTNDENDDDEDDDDNDKTKVKPSSLSRFVDTDRI